MCRIENSAGSGVCDVSACRRGREVWIELKVFKGNKIWFRKSQPSWIARRTSHGGRIFVLARKRDDLLLYRGADLPLLLKECIAEVDGSSSGIRADPSLVQARAVGVFPKPFNYAALAELIFSEGNQWIYSKSYQ